MSNPIDASHDADRGDDLDDGKPDAARLRFRVESLLRELTTSGRALPVMENVDLSLLDADERVAALDLVTIAAWIRHMPASDLALEPCRSLLNEGVAAIGVARAYTIAATLDDLEAELAQAPRHQPEDVWIGGLPPRDARSVLADLRRRTAWPGGLTLAACFGVSSRFEELKTAFLAVNAGKTGVAEAFDEIHARALVLIERALPADFATRLRALVAACGLNVATIAAACGTNVQNVRRLLSGTAPRRDMASLIAKLEGTVGATPGSLWTMVVAPRMRVPFDEVYTQDVQRALKVAGVHADFLPADWESLDRDAKQEVIDWIKMHVIAGTPIRRIAQVGHERHGDMSALMAEEFERLKTFKTAALPTEAFQRKKKTRINGSFTITEGGRWRTTTARTASGYLLRTLGAIDRLCPDQSWKQTSGLGFLIHPGLQRQAADAIAQQRYETMLKADAFAKMGLQPPSNERVFGEADVARLETIMGLFNATTGYFSHRAPVIRPIPGLIDEPWVEAARHDWRAAVADSLPQLRALTDEIMESVQTIRDPWLPILPILELDEPMTPLLQAFDQMAHHRPSFYGTPMVAALHDRDHVLIGLLLQAKLRRANYTKLTWRPDNTGNLRWDLKGCWKLVIPQRDMKNEGSGALPADDGDLVLVLDPHDHRLYASIESYLGRVDPLTGHVNETGSSRRLLHGDYKGDHLFPGRIRQGGIDEDTIGSIVLKFSARYLVGRPWSEVGIMGVMPFGTHAIRDIVATHVIKNTGSIEEAARALFDTVRVLERHYARFTSEEKSRRTNEIMRRTTRR